MKYKIYFILLFLSVITEFLVVLSVLVTNYRPIYY